MEPARSRDSNADVDRPGVTMPLPASFAGNEGDLKGLVEGVGFEVIGSRFPALEAELAGENRDGTVPARDRRGVVCVVLSAGGMKSGNPS